MLRTDQIAQLPYRIGAVPEVPEFLCTVQRGRVENYMRVDMFFVNVGTDKKSVPAFQKKRIASS